MIEQYRINSIDYKPSPIIALATNPNQSHVAAARDDGSLEIWLVSPGSVGWHCLLTIHGDPKSRVTSLVWCRSSSGFGRLFGSRIDGSVYEWDLFSLNQKIVLESIGTSIWQMAIEPCENWSSGTENESRSDDRVVINGSVGENGGDSSDSDVDDLGEFYERSAAESYRLALACDDGCVRLYTIADSDELTYHKSLPRVSGRALSLTWSLDGKFIYSGSSDGFIRCWDATYGHELYRITVGLGGLGSGNDLCVWSLLALRCGVLVSADSTGSVQFWDSRQGTLLDTHSYHKGDVYALAASPSHRVVFSAGADGKVILYKLSSNASEASDKDNLSSEVTGKWIYVDCKAAHSNDIRALTVAVPISREDLFPEEKVKRARRKKKPLDFGYHKWAHLGVPMLLSGGDDTKIFAYSANEFLNYKPHDVCVAPQRVLVHMVQNSIFNKLPLLLVQASKRVDIFSLQLRNGMIGHKAPAGAASTKLLVSVNSKASVKITCSAISPSGSLFSFSNNVKSSLFELKCSKDGKHSWSIIKRQLPGKLPSAHAMTYTSDSSRLIVAGHDKRIYVVDVGSAQMIHVFTPHCKTEDDVLQPSEPPITKLFTSSDGQWLAAVNCFGDIYVFNMEIQKQHWFISRLDGASVTAGGFHPHSNNALIITTSSNLVYAFDVEAKKLGDWSRKNSFSLPRRFQEFPGEVIGVSFSPSPSSSSAIVYSSRAMCLIDFGEPVEKDDSKVTISNETNGGLDSLSKKKLINSNERLKRKLEQSDFGIKLYGRKNFEISYFVNPVFYVGHLSERSVLVVDKPWKQVVKTLDTKPVHRHIYGS